MERVHSRTASITAFVAAVAVVACGTHPAAADLSGDITRAIQPIANKMAAKYNCAVSVAVYNGGAAGFDARVAGGFSDQYDPAPKNKVADQWAVLRLHRVVASC